MTKRYILALIGAIFVMQAPVYAGRLGPFVTQPRINLTMMTTDNLFNSRQREKYTDIVIVNPGLSLKAGRPVLNFTIDLDVAAGFHSRSSDDDYVDTTLSGAVVYNPTSRVRFDINASQEWGHDARGTGRSEGSTRPTLDPDEYSQQKLAGKFTYGAKGAKGRLILEADYLGREYTNNRAVTRGLDHDEVGLGATFKWRVMPKTSLIAEVRHREFDYDFTPLGTTKLDSDEQRYFIGAEWDATFKTTGSIRLGRYHKDFDDSSLKDISGGAWEAGVEWRPRSYSVVNLATGRRTDESTGSGSATVTDYYDASWKHAWVDRFSTTLGYSFEDADYSGVVREDETSTYTAGAEYKMRHWLDLGAGIEHIAKDSTDRNYDYSRNNLFVTAKARF